MAVTDTKYGPYLVRLLTNTAPALDSDTIKVVLLTSSYTPDYDTHEFYSDLTDEVGTGGGYTAGGQALAAKMVGYDSTLHRAYFDASDLVWPGLNVTFRYAALLSWTGSAATSPLIMLIDFGSDQNPAGVAFTLAWADPASGAILKSA